MEIPTTEPHHEQDNDTSVRDVRNEESEEKQSNAGIWIDELTTFSKAAQREVGI